MSKKPTRNNIVRRRDINGRKYYVNKDTGKKTSGRAWAEAKISQREAKEERRREREREQPKKAFYLEQRVAHRNFTDTVKTRMLEGGAVVEVTDNNGVIHQFSEADGNTLDFALLMKKIWKNFERFLNENKVDTKKVSPDIILNQRDYIGQNRIEIDLREIKYNF